MTATAATPAVVLALSREAFEAVVSDADTLTQRADSLLREAGWFVRCQGSADADRGSEVIENHHGVRNRAGEREELTVLVVVMPGVVGKPARAESGDAGTECRVLEQSGRRPAGDHEAVGRFGVCQCCW